MKFLCRVLFLAAWIAAAQSSQPSQPAANDDAAQLATLVKQQFGATFQLPTKFPTPLVTADFDGDGVEDVAIVAGSKDPLPDSFAFKYQVSDPYHAFFGFGDPKITSSLSKDPEHTHDVLVIFGSGKDAWHAAVPKAKFVLINVPFDSLEVGRMLISKKKPPIFVIKALETQVMSSAVWFDAKKKKWKWEPGDTIE